MMQKIGSQGDRTKRQPLIIKDEVDVGPITGSRSKAGVRLA